MMNKTLNRLFAGFLPVVVDVETAGVNPQTDALLEVAACVLQLKDGQLVPGDVWHEHVTPYPGLCVHQEALDINRIIPDHPFRMALLEEEALKSLIEFVKNHCQSQSCERAILIGHNAHFDLEFLNQAYLRHNLTSPFHRFRVMDTVTLSMVHLGVSVLAKALRRTRIGYDPDQAHGALYDTIQTARLFCHLYHDRSRKAK